MRSQASSSMRSQACCPLFPFPSPIPPSYRFSMTPFFSLPNHFFPFFHYLFLYPPPSTILIPIPCSFTLPSPSFPYPLFFPFLRSLRSLRSNPFTIARYSSPYYPFPILSSPLPFYHIPSCPVILLHRHPLKIFSSLQLPWAIHPSHYPLPPYIPLSYFWLFSTIGIGSFILLPRSFVPLFSHIPICQCGPHSSTFSSFSYPTLVLVFG